MKSFQTLIQTLTDYWASKGCAVQFGYDLEMGAGTFNPATFFKSLGPEPYAAAYVEPSRRPTDGRYGDNPNRLQHYFQFQVIMKPSPANIQALYLESLEAIGLPIKQHDVRFVHDDWKSPTLGAWGLGWEVQVDGMEVSQFTYFQNMGGQDLNVVTGEITYGLERIAMYLQGVDSVYDLKWNENLTYGDIYHQSEVEWSTYNFEQANVTLWQESFENYEKEVKHLIQNHLPIPAYDFVMKASHSFNILDARGVISVTERTHYISRIRALACLVAKSYVKGRERLNFPLLRHKKERKEMDAPLIQIKGDPDKREDFVLEIGSEELPQSFVPIGMKNLKKDLKNLLTELGLSYENIETYGTPRRLVAYVSNLACATHTSHAEKRGPMVSKAFDAQGAPTPLGQGFLAALKQPKIKLKDIESGKIKNLSIRNIKDVDYLFVSTTTLSESAAALLQEHLPGLIKGLEFPKKMTWSDLGIPFARPLRWLLAMHGSTSIPIKVADVLSDRLTYGHRILAPNAIPIKKSKDYFKALSRESVVLDPKEREAIILGELSKLEKKYGAVATNVDELLKELVYLCEYPKLIVGHFDPKYLDAPKELIKLVMIVHQRYFPLENAKGELLPHFVVCVDNKPTEKMRQGHEKAITPRLADGLFVYHKDLNLGLGQMVEKLQDMTFQKELGNLSKKSERIFCHAHALNPFLQSKANDATLKKAAHLLKADLASNLVFEFPELQGVIGSHYALLENEPDDISKAIEEHWRPRFEEDELPSSDLGLLFALADKMDNLLSCFLTGKIPSSSSDPYALRRQTLGIIRILIEHKIHLPLDQMIEVCAAHFELNIDENALNQLKLFVESRMKTVLTQYELRADEIQAVLNQKNLDIYDLYLRAKALHVFKSEKQFEPFMEVFKRAKGQLNISVNQGVDPALFHEECEKDLYHYLLTIEEEFLESLDEHQYEASFFLLSSLQPHLAKLFNEVKILCDNDKVRMNRIALLHQVMSLFNRLLDFTQVSFATT